jgi:hypothetical protein
VSTLGVRAVRVEVLTSLKNLLRLEQHERNTPSLRHRSPKRPLFITGMPRSASAFLHRLSVQDPTPAAPLSWQLVYPYPSAPPGRFGAA